MTNSSDRARTNLDNTPDSVAADTDNAALLKFLNSLEVEIANERQRPFTQLKNYFIFKLLTVLSQFSPPVPPRMAARFARSASKKDPSRTLDSHDIHDVLATSSGVEKST